MKVNTSHFGEMDVQDDQVLTATAPIPGFPDSKQYFFIERDNIKPFKWLQSADDDSLTFVVVETATFFHDYEPKFGAFDLKEIGLSNNEGLVVLAIVVLPEDLTKMTANLRGPIILNPKDRLFKQVFIETDRWTVRESIVDAIKRKELAAIEKNKAQQKANNKP